MANITTTALVNKIYLFCEAYSGIKFFPYQTQFAKRIIRSVLINDGDEITALFSRQCVEEDMLVTMGDGSKKAIKEVIIGDKVLTFDYNNLVEKEVTNAYYAGEKEVYEVTLLNGNKIITSLNHRLLNSSSHLFEPLYTFEGLEKLVFIDKNNKVKKSNIKNIKHMGIRNTYDLEVWGTENFICQDFLTHNSGKSEVVATITGGLAIILPTLANLPMFAGDIRLDSFKNGVLIGIFAPVLRQAQIVFNRIKQRMNSNYGQAIMNDPSINVDFGTNNGQNIVLTNGIFNSLISCVSASEGSNIEGDSYHIIIVDESQDVGDFKFSKSISPMGAFYNATKILIGTPTIDVGFFHNSIERNKRDYLINKKRRNHFEYDCDIVSKYNPKYAKYLEGEKIRLGEESDEYQMSYKLKWMLQRGMFITAERLASLGNDKLTLSLTDLSRNHVGGLDLGKAQDSTVLTILEVDWENPILVERSSELEVPDFIAYYKRIKAWLEIQGDDWEEQYPQIMDFLNNFSMARLVVDATGLGSPIYSRLSANLNCEVIPYVFTQTSKSDLFKNLDSELKSERLQYPSDEYSKDQREFKSFIVQMKDAQKTYSGTNMIVTHPNTRDGHDDYVTSLGLACWGAKGEGVDKPITEKNVLHEFRKKGVNTFYHSRNLITARRR